MIKDFSKYKLPKIYKKEKGNCYLDPIRKRLSYITPEETVRQQVLTYLLEDLNIPASMIRVEESLTHYGLKSKDRADILIHKMIDEGLLPIAVIECKAPNIYLSNKEFNQVADYADALGIDYIMLTNGKEALYYHYDETQNDYFVSNEFPNYNDMINNQFELLDIEPPPKRIPFKDIEKLILDARSQGFTGDIGMHTPLDKAVMAFNLSECLLDINEILQPKKYRLFELKEDLGVRILSYGNAGGGQFSGPYRSFLIEFEGVNQIISFAFSSYITHAHPDIEKTTLNVAIDTDDSAHHALQLVIDDNVGAVDDTYTFRHHGRIAVGNKGSGKIEELRRLVEDHYPEILMNKGFKLGTLKNDELFHLNDKLVEELIENLISYALIRDKYREIVKNRK